MAETDRTAPGDAPVVAMFVRNQFQHDARVTREANALIAEGFRVVVFAVSTTPENAGPDRQGDIEVYRVTLPTAVSRFVTRLGTLVGLYARLASRARRLSRRVRRLARRVRRKVAPAPANPTKGSAAPGKTPGVAAAQRAKVAVRDFVWPSHRFLQGLRFGRLAGARAAALKPVAYHCHDLNAIVAGFRAQRVWPAPVIYDSHELWPHRNRPDARRRKTAVVSVGDRFFARRADAVITVNDSIAEYIRRRYGVREVVVVRNMPSVLTRIPSPHAGMLEGIPHPRLIYVGGIQTHRGLEEMIDATALMTEATFVAVGPGNDDYRTGLERRAEAAGVAERVRFIPWVPPEAIVDTIAGADLGFALIKNYCLSYYLSLPNKFFEYLHAGLPVIASNFPEMLRIVERYDVGATCDPADPDAIARTVESLLARPEELKRMRDNALEASKELNWEHERERLTGLYKRLIPAERWPR